jgi:NTP pyrophosphatase (non-canonical NTP hydrolase)
MNKHFDMEKIDLEIKKFASDRNWEQFHSPKNLAMALSVESSELLEIFQWLNEEDSKNIMNDLNKSTAVKDEMADVLNYLIRLSQVLNIDLEAAFWDKMKKNADKYPIEKANNSSKKYTEF